MKTTTKNMLIIKDATGKIIAAQVESSTDDKIVAFITPVKDEHTMHRVSEVPSEICDLSDPENFRKAITEHVNATHAKVTPTSAAEVHASLSRAFAARRESRAK